MSMIYSAGQHLQLALVEHVDPLRGDDVFQALAEGVGGALDLRVELEVGHPVDVLQPVAISHRPVLPARHQLDLPCDDIYLSDRA